MCTDAYHIHGQTEVDYAGPDPRTTDFAYHLSKKMVNQCSSDSQLDPSPSLPANDARLMQESNFASHTGTRAPVSTATWGRAL